MKKLVLKTDLNLGFGKILKEGTIVELQGIETENRMVTVGNTRNYTDIKSYRILVPSVGIGVFSKEEFNTYFEEHKEDKQIKDVKNIQMDGLSEKIKVIRSGNATIVILSDGTKGVSKCMEEDEYDKEKGFGIAYTKACIKRLNKNLKELIK